MKNLKFGLCFSIMALSLSLNVAAKNRISETIENDSLSDKGKNDRGILLNAANATEVRTVEIGLPIGSPSVLLNGLPVIGCGWPNSTSNHWRSEMLLSHTNLMTIPTVAVSLGEIGYGVDSYMETGGDIFKGKIKYIGNNFGAQNFDLNLSGPLARKWYYTLSAYQNFDPGSFDLKFTNFADRAQFYTAGLTHLFNNDRSSFSVYYKYNNLHPLTTASNYAPFIYNGDGSVSELDNFRIGRDSYFPVDGRMTYRDARTGEMKDRNLYDVVKTRVHEVSAFFDHPLNDKMQLSLKTRFSTADNGVTNQLTMGVLKDVTTQYADGSGSYTGNVQRRLSQIDLSKVNDFFFAAVLKGRTGSHDWKLGLNETYSHVDYARSTTQYYHEIAPNPKKVVYDGKVYSDFNSSTEYDKGFENRLALYLMDTWKIGSGFKVDYGVRLEYFHLDVNYIPNRRFSDFYLGTTYTDEDGKQQTVATTNHVKNGLNYDFTLVPTWNITPNFGLTGEIHFLRQYRHLEGYSGTELPYYSYRPFTLGRAGIFYNNPFINVVSAFTYGRRTNDYARLTVMSDDVGQNTAMVGASSGIETIGWTTDAMIYPFTGFQLHFMLTLQSPKYTGYNFEAFGKQYDFSDKTATQQSKVLIEIDPSYTYKRFNVWANFRYFSKQYVNVGNSVYFNGRWETFAGVNYKVNKFLTLNANTVNFLNQKGAKGSISGSELITDGSKYAGTLMAGGYIRPFTVEVGAKINF
ncbi:TonB-dependent receptor [Phocaeicola sp.]